jgi:hypothetical protein
MVTCPDSGLTPMPKKEKIILTMMGAVYVDARKTKSIIAIKPKPPT